MVKTTIVDFVSEDTLLVNKLHLTRNSSKAIRASDDAELVFFFLKELSLTQGEGTITHDLWIGIGTIIEITDAVLVVRYLPTSSDVPVVGHSLHKPSVSLAVLTATHRLLRKSRDSNIDRATFALLRSLRRRICPTWGCIFEKDSSAKRCCSACMEARDTQRARTAVSCVDCGRDVCPNSRFCPQCSDERESASNEDDSLENANWEMMSWDERDDEAYRRRHGES